MKQSPITIIGLSGSIREGSYNTELLHALAEFIPAGVEYKVESTLGDLPLYSPDLEAALPQRAISLRSDIRSADALIIASPEYNYSFSAVIKNAIEWLTRPPTESTLEAKPVALVGAAPGLYGTVRGQTQLRQVLHGANAHVLARPEVYINEVAKKFDSGQLSDPVARELSSQLITNLVNLTRRYQAETRVASEDSAA